VGGTGRCLAARQAHRRAIDAAPIGRPVAGAAAALMERWHPNPEFFFKRGGPYYVTQLVNLLGPSRESPPRLRSAAWLAP
jgi:hypothetical protein